MSGLLRLGLNWEFAGWFQNVVKQTQVRHLPEVAARWPMKSHSSQSFLRNDLLVVVIEPRDQEAMMTVATAQPSALDAKVYDLWATGKATHSALSQRFVESHPDAWSEGRFLGFARLPVKSRQAATVADVVKHWKQPDFDLWNAGVNAAFVRLVLDLLDNPPPQTETGVSEPIRNPNFKSEHPSFPQPADLDLDVWRYTSLAKFVALLSSGSLYFARGDLLGDDWEGAVGGANKAYDESHFPDRTPVADRVPRNFISCWHAQDHESMAMWSQYAERGRGSYGVAMHTSYRDLIDAVKVERDIFAGLVTYRDYSNEYVPTANAFDVWMSKRLSFAHEAEMRMLISLDNDSPSPDDPGQGLLVPIDLHAMRPEVRVSPASPVWFRDTVEATCRAFGYEFDVRRSDMDDEPLK